MLVIRWDGSVVCGADRSARRPDASTQLLRRHPFGPRRGDVARPHCRLFGAHFEEQVEPQIASGRLELVVALIVG